MDPDGNTVLWLIGRSVSVKTRSTGRPHDELDHLFQSDHGFVHAESAPICDIRLVDLDRGWDAAISHTIDGQNLHDELTELCAQACIGHGNQELRVTVIHWMG